MYLKQSESSTQSLLFWDFLQINYYIYAQTCLLQHLFEVEKYWKQPECLPVGTWLNNLWYIYKMEYYVSFVEENGDYACVSIEISSKYFKGESNVCSVSLYFEKKKT